MNEPITDPVPVDPSAETSLDNVLTNIRFRNAHGFRLFDYQFSPDFTSVELQFVPCAAQPAAKNLAAVKKPKA